MVISMLSMKVQPEKRRELVQTLRSLLGFLGREGGCMERALYEDSEDENGLLLYEEWHTRSDLERHILSEQFSILLGATTLLVSKPVFRVCEITKEAGRDSLRKLKEEISTGLKAV